MMDEGKVIYPELSYKIVGCLFEVFKKLGPNHREKYYQNAVAAEFTDRNIKFVEYCPMDLRYKEKVVGKNFLDFMVEDKIILELKTGRYIRKSNFEQILSYLKTSGLKLGIIAVFSAGGVKFHRILNN